MIHLLQVFVGVSYRFKNNGDAFFLLILLIVFYLSYKLFVFMSKNEINYKQFYNCMLFWVISGILVALILPNSGIERYDTSIGVIIFVLHFIVAGWFIPYVVFAIYNEIKLLLK